MACTLSSCLVRQQQIFSENIHLTLNRFIIFFYQFLNNYVINFKRNYYNNLLKSYDIVLKEKPSKFKEMGYLVPKKLVMYILNIFNLSLVINLFFIFHTIMWKTNTWGKRKVNYILHWIVTANNCLIPENTCKRMTAFF